jgi:hypothetical protein
MKTHTTMLSSLAIAALATVTLNSTEALAKSGGGGGGGGGMRSFSSARSFSATRTSPVVIKQFKTVTTPSVKKLTTTKLATIVVRDHRIKPAFLTDKKITLNPQPLPPGNAGPIKPPGGVVVDPTHPPVVVGPVGPIKPPGGVIVDPTHPPVVVGPIGPIKPPGGVIVDPTHPPVVVGPIGPIKPPGGVIVDPTHPPVVVGPIGPIGPIKPPGNGPIVDPLPPAPPPVVVNPPAPPVVVIPPAPVSVGFGVAAAAEAIDPPGCTYERSVRKLPGGGLQRVIVKVCPDVIVR